MRRDDELTGLDFPVLIGDIGGTNARFAILVDAQAEPKEFPNVETASFGNIDEAIQSAILDKTAIQPRSAVLAVAGPVSGDEIDLTQFKIVGTSNQLEKQYLRLTAAPDPSQVR